MSNDVGWFDKEGRFYVIHGAKAGEFRPVETGLGPCVVKMRRSDNPPDNVREIIAAKAKARAEPHKVTFNKAKRDGNASAVCSCGWTTSISSFGFVTDKSAKREADRRHNAHLKDVGRL